MSSKTKIGSWLIAPQPRLGIGGLIVLMLCTVLSTPLALDMYTPAVPAMVDEFSSTEAIVNLTMVGFYAAGAVGLLLFGTVSDKFGRKPVLLAGALVYLVSCYLCSISQDIGMLIVLRICAALGSGAMGAVGTAIVKDAIVAEHREKLISLVQVMFVIGPVLSPVIGALLLQVGDWRFIFRAMALFGALATVLALLFKETLPVQQRTTDGVFRTIGHLGIVLRNKAFTLFLTATALVSLPFMAYIAVGSYIYEEFFGLSELGYSAYFAIAAIVSAFGPVFYLLISRKVTVRSLTTFIFLITLVMGVALIVLGWISPLVFCLIFSLFALFEASIRPYSMNILLNQQENDTGAASSLMNFANTVFGSIGMLLAVIPWPNFIVGIGVLLIVSAAGSLAIWTYILKRPVEVKGL